MFVPEVPICFAVLWIAPGANLPPERSGPGEDPAS
jgi:hypothetical protein